MVVEPALRAALVKHDALMPVVICFLVGCGCQVFIAFVNKILAWCGYYGAANPKFKNTWRYKIAHEMGRWFVWDIALDIITIVSFCRATLIIFSCLVPEAAAG